MAVSQTQAGLLWDNATSFASKDALRQTAPLGSLVHDTRQNCDQIAVVYDKGQRPPHITINRVSGSVHTVLADGIAVAVVASASRPVLNPDDVLLVERTV
ncbi:hypothetical protein [Roseobacter sp. GAI101]|uniref:hypothetical protein n=1 Tax=Roseobacter sp. (strain GAI101) TaxID=391589 RepID=UPI0001871A8B|nr:hypothetical protein [Roseobacter sp. GAI101]EEB84143.1 conserved hypothetical protein [Roseobacter sp. GAI101]